MPSTPAAKLPEGWESVVDPESAETYYWNQLTDATTWNPPTHRAADDVERERFLYAEQEKLLAEQLASPAPAGLTTPNAPQLRSDVSQACLSGAGVTLMM